MMKLEKRPILHRAAIKLAALSLLFSFANAQGGVVSITSNDPVNWADAIASAPGKKFYVRSGAEFRSAASQARPGDVVIVRNGTYSDFGGTTITSAGTSSAPIIYTAESAGGVTLVGSLNLFRILGKFNVIGGFVFKQIPEHVIEFTGNQGPGTTGASDNRITGNTFIENGKTRPYWMIELRNRSHRNRVDHNTFDRNYGHIRVRIDEADSVSYGPSQDLRIDHNVFKNTLTGNSLGWNVPVAQFGQGENSRRGSGSLDTRVIFEYNSMENHRTGYDEIISVKSSGNILRYNSIINSDGGFSLREGGHNQVYGNYVKGTGSSGGIAILGAYNSVYNNVLDVAGRDFGISMARWGLANDGILFPPTHDNLVAYNTIINPNRAGIDMGFCLKGACNPAYNVTVVNNIIVGNAGQLFEIRSGYVTSGLLVRNNLYYATGSALLTTGYAADRAPIVGNPGISNPLSAPTASIVKDRAYTMNQVAEDFYRRPRIAGSAPDVGAIEAGSTGTVAAAITSTTSTSVAPTTSTTTTSGNIARGRPAYASSVESNSSSWVAGKAFDGNRSTRWSSAFADPQWISVDLGTSYNLGRVVLAWETAYASQYRIQVSNDGSNWSTVYTQLYGTGGTESINLPSGVSGRYVRMYSMKRKTAWGNSLWEFEVYAR